MDLQNSAVGGVAGRVPSWINRNRAALADILEEGVNQYISKHTDPYVLDNAKATTLVCVPTKDEAVGLGAFPTVPCLQALEDSYACDNKGNKYKAFPPTLFEGRFKECVDLLIRLVDCSQTYYLGGQKVKKQIFQTLFSNDDKELTELLEDEA